MFRPRIFRGLGLAVALALTFGARSASADVFTYDLVTQNGALTGPGPYVEVSVNRTSTTTATFTYTGLTSGGFSYFMFDGSSAAANINATTFTVTNIAGTGPGTPSLSLTNPPGTSNVSTFGSFNLVIDDADGFNNRTAQITFDVTSTSGPSWTTAADVTALNNQNQILADHVGELAPGGTEFANTGFVSGATSVVPEPSTMAIAGLGALGFIGYGLRRRLKK